MLPILGPSEQRVIQALIGGTEPSVDLSTAELAGAGTSPATVIRACQNVGFCGYQRWSPVRSAETTRSTPS